jgi:hypothetical protein
MNSRLPLTREVLSLAPCLGIGIAVSSGTATPIADTILSATDGKENSQ